MSLRAKNLPQATPIDPAADPPGSIDPLGTLSLSEKLAEVIFPGFTARMWRPRFLTIAAITSLVTEHVVRSSSTSDNSRLAARLGFERLFVSSLVRMQIRESKGWEHAVRGLPGSSLARTALRSGDVPLSRNNFLKGQAVNGLFGVIARLARQLGIIDEDNRLDRCGEELLLAWTTDEGMPGLLDDDNNDSMGRQWLERFIKATIAHIAENQWKSYGWGGWRELAKPLRPDNIGKSERRVLISLLHSNPITSRCLVLLREPQVVSLHNSANEIGEQNRKVLINGILPLLLVDKYEEDKSIKLTIHLIDAYEHIAYLLEAAFNGLLWGLTVRGGRARSDELVADQQLQPFFQSLCQPLLRATESLRECIEKIPDDPCISDSIPVVRFDTLVSQAAAAAINPKSLVEIVLKRHQDVQKAKNKGMWIDLGEEWILIHDYDKNDNESLMRKIKYLHTFRVPNAYSFLGEMQLAKVGNI